MNRTLNRRYFGFMAAQSTNVLHAFIVAAHSIVAVVVVVVTVVVVVVVVNLVYFDFEKNEKKFYFAILCFR